MDREQTLDLALEIRKRINQCKIGIRWPSSEMQVSAGDRRSARRGPGDEHDSMKEYEPGDDLRHIDWAATAEESDRDTIIIKTFFEPRVVRFSVLLDLNRSMNFGTSGSLKSRLGALSAACGIYSAAKMKDRVSYVTYDNAPLTIRKNQGASRVLTDFLIHAIEDGKQDLAVSEKNQSGGGLAAAFNSVRKEHRGLVLVVSDFVNMSEDDWEALRISGFKNDTIAVFVQDLRERELPETPWPGASYTFEDWSGRSKTLWVAPDQTPSMLSGITSGIGKLAARLSGAEAMTTREQYRQNFRKHEAAVLDRLESYGIKPVVVSTEAEEDGVRSLLRLLASKLR